MRRIVIALMTTISGLVLLFVYPTSTNAGTAVASGGTSSTGSNTTPTTSSSSDSSSSGSTGSGGSTAGSGSTSSSSSSTAASGSGSGTYTGDAVQTRWGIVQVQITVSNGKITKSEAVQYPTENPRDQEINAYAVPQLNSEAVAANSAQIDAVSGATVTSDGYIQSLQSAVDQAKL